VVFTESVNEYDRLAGTRFSEYGFNQKSFWNVNVRSSEALEGTLATVTFGFDPGTTTNKFYHLYWINLTPLISEDVQISLPPTIHSYLMLGVQAYIQADKYGDVSRFENWLHTNGNKIRFHMNSGSQGVIEETQTQPEYSNYRYRGRRI